MLQSDTSRKARGKKRETVYVRICTDNMDGAKNQCKSISGQLMELSLAQLS